MPDSLTNSIDIIANSVSVVQNNTIVNILDIISQITGLAAETFNTLQKLAASINNDNTFYNTINNQMSTKANSVDVSIKIQTCTQTEINALLSTTQASSTSTTALSLGFNTTSGSITTNKIITRYV